MISFWIISSQISFHISQNFLSNSPFAPSLAGWLEQFKPPCIAEWKRGSEKGNLDVAERHSHGGDREVGQGRGEVARALCFCYVKDSAEVTKEVVVMVVVKDAT